MSFPEPRDPITGKARKHQEAALKRKNNSNWTKKETKNSIVWTNKEMNDVTVEIHHSIFEAMDSWGKNIEVDYYHVFLAMNGFPVSDYSEEVTEWPLSQIEPIAKRYRDEYDKKGIKLMY